MVSPYRQPEPTPTPPRDAMRVVLIVCGSAAGLIVLFALFTAWMEHRAAVATAPHAARPGFDSFAYEIHAGDCFGPCVPYTVSIDTYGTVTRTADSTWSCLDTGPKRVSDEDRKRLAERALALPLDTLKPRYLPALTDVQELHTSILIGDERHDFEHPGRPAAEREALPLVDMHAAIAAAAHVDEWLASCKTNVSRGPWER